MSCRACWRSFLIVTLSSIGLPGLNGFVGEFLILLGTFGANPRMAAFAATGVILSAVYMLWMFQRVNYGQMTNEKNAGLVDLRPREWFALVPIIVVAILMGMLPNLFLRPMEPSVERMLNQYRRGTDGQITTRRARSASPRVQTRGDDDRASNAIVPMACVAAAASPR